MTVQEQNFAQKINTQEAETFAQENAKSWGFPYVDLNKVIVNPDILPFLPKEKAVELSLVLFDKRGKLLRLATPKGANQKSQEFLSSLKKENYEVEVYICSEEAFANFLQNYKSAFVTKKTVQIASQFDEKNKNLSQNIVHFKTLESALYTKKIPEILSEIYLLSLASGASDIHFQPSDEGTSVRLRINGVLEEVLKMPAEIGAKCIPQIKYDGGMKSNITASPQDGRIEFMANNRPIELRVSTLPMTPYESVVMRILDSHKGIKSFSELGFFEHIETKMKNVLRQKEGIVLVTGPTGSGKTTTLYSMLKEINTPEKKVVTLEDPVEYHLEGITQSQVNEQEAYNFETGFKSILRHDPDVILVGEVRTIPTAKLAFEAALTGHTVLTSLHTNSAVGAISRLRNMGMENYNIAPTINAVFAQKLIRKIPGNFSGGREESLEKIIQTHPLIAQGLERIKKLYPQIKIPEKIVVDVDSETKDGFVGQTVICEAFVINDHIREMILKNHSEIEIKKYLLENTDYLSLFENGLLKLLERKTTLKELLRVVGV